MAARLGMDRNAYRNIEVGKTAIVHDKLDAIADILMVPAERFLLGYDPLDMDSDPRLATFKKEYGLRSQQEQEYSRKEIVRLKAEIIELRDKIDLLQGALEDKTEIIKFLKNKKK